MNTSTTIIRLSERSPLNIALAVVLLVIAPVLASAQSVSEIITDYGGFWKTSSTAISPVKPDNHHNLLSFSFNGTRYSTGVNDALLTSQGQPFTPGVYQALPLQNVNGTISGNTKIGLGAMADGVFNGAGPAPSRNLGPYLNDGSNGLDMGTCVANLPLGYMFMSVSNIQSAKIGDGIPDIVVTQIADPSSTYDSYEFTDVNGNRIGNSLDVVLNNITPVGSWVADFYEATGSSVLTAGFTQTQRDIRLWAADFSSFGLNASNIGSIAYFKINLSGQSDIAFVAYNAATITVQQVLAMPQTGSGRLTRTTQEEVSTVSVFPNPSTSAVTVSHPKSDVGDRILIYGMNGVLAQQVIPATGSTNTRMNVSAMPKGTYQLVYSGRVKKQTQKLVLQ